MSKRDITTELLIARAVDLSHASGAQHRQNFVAAKASSIGEMRGPIHCAAIIGRRLERVDSFRGRKIESRSPLAAVGESGMGDRTTTCDAELGELLGNGLAVGCGADLLVYVGDASVGADVEGPSRCERLIRVHDTVRFRRRLRRIAQNRKVHAERLGERLVGLGRIDADGEVHRLERPDFVATLTE
jgi:hypothetical protein